MGGSDGAKEPGNQQSIKDENEFGGETPAQVPETRGVVPLQVKGQGKTSEFGMHMFKLNQSFILEPERKLMHPPHQRAPFYITTKAQLDKVEPERKLM